MTDRGHRAMTHDRSPAGAMAERLVRSIGREAAHQAVDVLVSKFTNIELAAYAARWSEWARPKQLAPAGDWTSWGFLTGRGFGKTFAMSHFVNDEIEAGRAPMVAIGAQDEANCVALQVLGPSGLVATANPWFKPEWEASKLELKYPNGSRVIVRTPEVPDKIRGFDYALSWITEIQSWPVAKRVDAYNQFFTSTRIGYRRIVWDCTPRRRHPVLLELLANAEREPEAHIVVRGRTDENPYLGKGYLSDLQRKFGLHTTKGREEIGGEMVDDVENALVQQAWIDEHRRHAPDAFTRRVIGVDPAVTNRAGNDRTGIVECGLGSDGQAYVLGDYSARLDPSAWAKVVLDRYVRGGCELVVVETNKGGDLVTQNLRASARDRGLTVVAVGPEEKPRKVAGTVHVKDVHARGAKEDRAQPVATAYEGGRVSHVIGAQLSELEDTLTTWEPTPGSRSPDSLDALTHAVVELLGLKSNKRDAAAGLRGFAAAGERLRRGFDSGDGGI